jgi:hypothetical protein
MTAVIKFQSRLLLGSIVRPGMAKRLSVLFMGEGVKLNLFVNQK